MNYYNENNPFSAQALRNLIGLGMISNGVVDERSIEDVRPEELAEYKQCHFFAGIGVWSYALRLAGWPDDRPVWTGSCPCQPFSAAGKGAGFADERHLWPAWHWLIEQRRPSVVFGEQVASKDGLVWLDTVHADMEASAYAIGAADLCAPGVGAPHIRQRIYFGAMDAGRESIVADDDDERLEGWGKPERQRRIERTVGADSLVDQLEYSESNGRQQWGAESSERSVVGRRGVGGLADAKRDDRGCEANAADHEGTQADRSADRLGRHRRASNGLADTSGQRSLGQHVRLRSDEGRQASDLPEVAGRSSSSRHDGEQADDRHGSIATATDAPHSFWRDADWLFCRDGKWRPVEPGTFPLANGVAGRVGLLHAYGNAIVAPLAAEWIETVMEYL